MNQSAVETDITHQIERTDESTAAWNLPPLAVAARLLWIARRNIFYTPLACALLGLGLAFLMPNEYEATARLMPPGDASEMTAAMGMAMSSGDGNGGASSMLGGMGGIAGQLLGLNNQSDLVVGVLGGDTVNRRIIERFDLVHHYKITSPYIEDCLKKLEAQTDFDVDHKSNLIIIKVRDRDPKLASEMAKAFAEEANSALARTNTSSAHRERLFLADRVVQAKVDLDNAAVAFSRFSSKNTMISLPDQSKAMVEAAAAVQGQMIAAEAQLRTLQSQYTNDNYRIRQAQAAVDELKQQLQKLGGKENGAGTIGKYDDIYPSIRQLPLLGNGYMDLYRQLKVDEAVYEMLTKELEASKIIEARTMPTVEILDAPEVPQKKHSPHRGIITAAVFLLAFFFSCAFIIGRWMWNMTSDSDETKLFLQEVLSSIRPYSTESRLGKILLKRFNRTNIQWQPAK